MPDQLPPTLTIDQAAELLQCDRDTAAARLASGELPGLKFGRSWVIPADAFMRRINELSMELAEQRRAESAQPSKKAGGAMPGLTVVGTSAAKRGRTRRSVPSLEKLQAMADGLRGVA